MRNRITNYIDLEIAARQFQNAVNLAYTDNCPSVARQYSRNISWWNQDLADRRRKIQRLFNATKRSGNWIDYKSKLTEYNKELRQDKRESWRRHCEEIEKVPECARLQKILSKDGHSVISSLQLEN
jgi:hypothetical protein